jgi:addiction module HigA family antidote
MTILRENLETLDLSDVVTGERNARATPGDILKEDFMDEAGLSARALGREIGIPANRISDIIRGKRAITAPTAIRLGRYFKVSPQMWMNLQSSYDLAVALEAEDSRRAA